MEHGKNAHKIVWNGKETKLSLQDEVFEWVGSKNEPTEKHTSVFDEDQKKRKKAISKGTKQRARLTAEVANMLCEWDIYEKEKHLDGSGAHLQLLSIGRDEILAKYKEHKANFPLVYKARETKSKPSPKVVKETTHE